MKEGETTSDIFAFLTTEPNKEVGAIHPKAMPVVLTAREEIDVWMTPSAKTEAEALMQRVSMVVKSGHIKRAIAVCDDVVARGTWDCMRAERKGTRNCLCEAGKKIQHQPTGAKP